MTQSTARWAQWSIFSLLLLVDSTPLQGATFNLSPPNGDINAITIGLAIGFLSDSQTSQASGTVEADLSWDIQGNDATVTELSLTGGDLSFSDVDFNIGLIVQGRELGGTLTTLNPPGDVMADGTFDASDHEMIINQGKFLVTGAPDFLLSENPFGGSGSGVGMVSLEEISRVSNQVTYNVTITVPIAFTDQQPAGPGSPIFIDIDVAGIFEGSSLFTVTVGQESADFDVDNDVDGRDFLAWQRGHGILGNATLANGDANSDTNVDALDLAVWQSQFGMPAAAAITAVPEPSTVALVLMMGGLLILRHVCELARTEGVRHKFSACMSMG